MTLIANVGVVAGIVFLAYEIRVASDSVSNAAAAGYVEIWRDFAENARDPEILSITGKINRDGWNSVPPDHVTRAVQWVLAGLRGGEFAHYQWRQGSLDPALWRGNDASVYRSFWQFPIYREVWLAGARMQFSAEFQDYIDQVIADNCSRTECRDETAWLTLPSEVAEGIESWLARRDV
jgi:hypothetical protein